MGSVLHGGARTTPRIRAELQASQESGRAIHSTAFMNRRLLLRGPRLPLQPPGMKLAVHGRGAVDGPDRSAVA